MDMNPHVSSQRLHYFCSTTLGENYRAQTIHCTIRKGTRNFKIFYPAVLFFFMLSILNQFFLVDAGVEDTKLKLASESMEVLGEEGTGSS